MTYLSEMQNRTKRSHIHQFGSKEKALAHLKEFDIEPIDQKFTLIAERHFGDKTFDALDYLSLDHNYKVQWI